MASTATPGSSNRRFPTDLRQAELNPYLTGSVRAVAPGVETPEAPLRATRSKSQPPHLVFEHPNYCHQNFASDHLLSGVNSHLKLAGELLSIVPE